MGRIQPPPTRVVKLHSNKPPSEQNSSSEDVLYKSSEMSFGFSGAGGNILINPNVMCLLLQVYCKTCQRCICAICVLEEHRMHKTVSVQTERVSKQVQVTEIRWSNMKEVSDNEPGSVSSSETGSEDGAGDPEPDQRERDSRDGAEEETGRSQGRHHWWRCWSTGLNLTTHVLDIMCSNSYFRHLSFNYVFSILVMFCIKYELF